MVRRTNLYDFCEFHSAKIDLPIELISINFGTCRLKLVMVNCFWRLRRGQVQQNFLRQSDLLVSTPALSVSPSDRPILRNSNGKFRSLYYKICLPSSLLAFVAFLIKDCSDFSAYRCSSRYHLSAGRLLTTVCMLHSVCLSER